MNKNEVCEQHQEMYDAIFAQTAKFRPDTPMLSDEEIVARIDALRPVPDELRVLDCLNHKNVIVGFFQVRFGTKAKWINIGYTDNVPSATDAVCEWFDRAWPPPEKKR